MTFDIYFGLSVIILCFIYMSWLLIKELGKEALIVIIPAMTVVCYILSLILDNKGVVLW